MTYDYRHLIVETATNDADHPGYTTADMLDGIAHTVKEVDGVIGIEEADMSNAYDMLKHATREAVRKTANDVALAFHAGDYGEDADMHDVAHQAADGDGLVFVNWQAAAVGLIAEVEDYDELQAIGGGDSPANVLAYCVVRRRIVEAIEDGRDETG